jgi:hypothetical protein
MTNPKNIYIVVNYLQFLTKHTVDIVQLVEKMLCLNHKLWALELEIRRSKRSEDKFKKTVTKVGTVNMSLNGVGGEPPGSHPVLGEL